jgi:hypothetical protein
MKNLIKRILKEGKLTEHSVIVAGFKFYIDDYISSGHQGDGTADIFLKVGDDSEPLTMEEYLLVEDELMSVGFKKVETQTTRGDQVLGIRVGVDVPQIIKIYIDGALSTKGMF